MLKPKIRQSSRCTHSPNNLKNFKLTLSARKVMAAVFWDRKGVLMLEFMKQETTMSEVYCKILKKLCSVIQTRGHGMLTSGVVVLHDNVHLHIAAHTGALLEHFNWELFDHPSYSPDLPLNDYPPPPGLPGLTG
jgi:hypothetical protein